jgi:hypothetical protein
MSSEYFNFTMSTTLLTIIQVPLANESDQRGDSCDWLSSH